jgi:hypothetical protein
MLLDLLDRFLTKVPIHLKEMGYLRELRGIRRRYRQWHWAWEPHCQKTKHLILAAMKRCFHQRKAVLFGTGYLHDVPIEELSNTFASVVLVDLAHPLPVRWQVRHRPNVHLLEADISATLEAIWQTVEVQGTTLPLSKPALFVEDGDIDLVVSVNLLSQLPCLPQRYLQSARLHTPEQINAYCRQVVESHIDYLKCLPGVVAIIADVETRTMSQAGLEMARKNTLYGAEFPWQGETWIWNLVPRRTAYPHHGEHLVVLGVEDIKAPAAKTMP